MENLTEKSSGQRQIVSTSKSFEQAVESLETLVGRVDWSQFQRQLGAAATFSEMEQIIHSAAGPSGLIEFARFDLGAILRKEGNLPTPKIMRLLIGNPLVMKEMVKHVPEAGSYAPVTILIDEGPTGVRLSYDRMTNFLAPYGNAAALQVAQDLDKKIASLLQQVAG